CDSLRTLREHLKVQVLTLLDHVPHQRSGRVGCLVILKNIAPRRAEDATDDSVRNGLAIPCSNILPGCLCHLPRRRAPEIEPHAIFRQGESVAVAAALTDFLATHPWV